MSVNLNQSFSKISYSKSSPSAPVVTNLAYAGYVSRRGVNGKRIAMTNGGYIYVLPTDYTRNQDVYAVSRTWSWQYVSGVLTPYISYEGPSTMRPNATSYDEYFTDSAYGVNPKAAAMTKAYNKLRDNTGNFAMLTKDLYDATKLAGSYFDRLNRAIPFLLKKRFRKAYQAFTGSHKIPKGMSNTWLEYQWGVLPSITAVQDSFKRVTTDPARTIRVTGGGKSEMTLLPKVDGSNANWDFEGSVVTTARCRCYRYYKNIASLEAAAFNPIEPAWDAVPWSFLVGWFIPIEEWLYQFAFVPSWIQVEGCDSVKVTTDYDIRQIRYCPTRFANGFPKSGSLLQVPMSGHRKVVEFKRTRATGILKPLGFGEMLARSEIGLTCKRLVSSVALTTQRLT